MRHAFTLIELLMVIAIIGIISTLAVNKVGGVREASARKVSLANQVAVERGVSSYLASGGRLNRLDALILAQGSDGSSPWRHGGKEAGGTGFDCSYTNFTAEAEELYLGPTRGSEAAAFRADDNAGVTPGLQAVVCPYQLSRAQADALVTRLGLAYLMAHNAHAADPAAAYAGVRLADGSFVESHDTTGKNPNESAVIPVAVTNAMTVLAISPLLEKGRAIYRACGQALPRSDEQGNYTETEAVKEVNETGGPLLAFGLGEAASLIGKTNAGLESAPRATYPARRFYSRYILLIRLRPVGSTLVPEFAGVLDPCAHTLRDAREIVRNL